MEKPADPITTAPAPVAQPRTTTAATPITNAPATTTPNTLEAGATDAAVPVDAKTAKKNKRLNRTPYALHKSRWTLRAIAFVFEFVAFFILVGIMREPWLLIFIGIPMVWNIAEFITVCVNRKGIHPGAHIALDLISFGFLTGPASATMAYWTYDDYDYDCSGSGPCRSVRRRGGVLAASVTSGAFSLVAGLVHLALFVIACIAVHKWRMARRDARFAQLQAAYRQPPPGQISIAGNMDSNVAYLITYPDGRQVLVPPSAAAQQYPPMQQQHAGFYAPQQQQQQQHYQQTPALQVAPIPMGGGSATVAQQRGGVGLPSTTDISQHSSPGTHVSAPYPTQQQQQQQTIGSNSSISGISAPTNHSGTHVSTPYSPQQQQQQQALGNNNNSIGGTSAPADHTGTSLPSSILPTAGHQQPNQQQQQQYTAYNPGTNRDSLYTPNSAIEAPEHGTTPRPGEAVPLRT